MARLRPEDKKRVRAKLLRTATEHFAAEGFEGASINRISLAAGFAKGTVYNYFPSKEALLEAILRAGGDAALERYRSGCSAKDVRGRLVFLVEADVEVVRANEALTRVLLRELVSGRASTRALIDESMREFVAEVGGILSDAEHRSPYPLLLQVRLFMGQLAAMYIEQFRSGFPGWERLAPLVVDTFLHGVSERD